MALQFAEKPEQALKEVKVGVLGPLVPASLAVGICSCSFACFCDELLGDIMLSLLRQASGDVQAAAFPALLPSHHYMMCWKQLARCTPALPSCQLPSHHRCHHPVV